MSRESDKIERLKARAIFLQKTRAFFQERGVTEVDTPILGKSAPIDEHIEIMQVTTGYGTGYLHSSPEYAMKRLLALGMGDIFQLSHVFRQGELGKLHNPEFTMIEWYRLSCSFSSIIEETIALVRLFLGPLPHKIVSYREALFHYAQIDYLNASEEELVSCSQKYGIHLSSKTYSDKETLLHLIMSMVVEPHLGHNELTVLIDYPASQAALALTTQKGEECVAKRFEVYHQGIELANGYEELTDAREQELRLKKTLIKRSVAHKEELPIDEQFLQALQEGFPPCCGVAAGFDRLFLLQQQASSLQDILPFSWEES
ncbi:MAG: EF-P lysine aminoacylase GenX [Chlamydiae bacterium]|nr:EF-P lysine aminoacylase GenX [Chlamydiota bacterium]